MMSKVKLIPIAIVILVCLLCVPITGAQTPFSCADVTEIPTTECEALVAFYDRTKGDKWFHWEGNPRDGWLQTTTPCSWDGVRCSSGHVVGLYKGDAHLLGVIPPEIGNLIYLTELSLGFNELRNIPAEIGNLTNLTRLSLSDNLLSTIPPEIGNLSNLTTLELSINQFVDVPAEIGNLTDLTKLTLSSNQLTTLPADILSLINLNTFRYDEDVCIDADPTDIEAWMNITNFNLQSCGFFPSTLFSCANVTEIPTIECEALVALYNSTNGDNWKRTDSSWVSALYPDIDIYDDVKHGWLRTNTPCSWFGVVCSDGTVIELNKVASSLSGEIPAEIGNLTNLVTLHLGKNQLTTIPPEIGNLTDLVELWLNHNQLTTIPAEIGNLTNLTSLQLGINQLTTLPAEIRNLTNLNTLSVSSNQFATVPREIGNLTNLTTLWLAYNPLRRLPMEIGYLTNLTEFVYDEGVCIEPGSGEIATGNDTVINPLPVCFTSCTAVTEIPASECEALVAFYNSTNGDNWLSYWDHVVGQVDTREGWLHINTPCDWDGVSCHEGHVHRISKDGHHLSGVIPAEIENLTRLTSLILYHNDLTDLPAEIGNLTSLTALYLFSNQLETIPAEIGNLVNLTILFLSNNQLTTLPAELLDLTNLTTFSSDAGVCVDAEVADVQAWRDATGFFIISCSQRTHLFLPMIANP